MASNDHLLYSFIDFPGSEQRFTYSEIETQLKSVFQLLKFEIIDFFFPSLLTISSNNKFHLYATNWALRFIFDFPPNEASLFHNFVIPLKTIIKMKKVGHKNQEIQKFGIRFFFSSGCNLFIQFPEIEGLRSQFKKRVKILKKNAFKFNEQIWIPNPSWLEKLTLYSNYDLMWNFYCKTYPRYLLIPFKIPAYFIKQSSRCRTHKRFPFITYFYESSKTAESCKIALFRSSQPLNILNKMCCSYEQQYLANVCGGKDLTIIDCRPKTKAIGYQLIGRGYESKKDFKEYISDVHFHFLGIPHANQVRSIFISMMKKIFHRKSDAFKKWGKITMKVLNGACFVVNRMTKMLNNVLVHCSNGWDRTSQICSLSQLMIDSNFRTLKGFIELIQKDWIDMGHMFSTRCSYDQCNNDNESSPIFALFIDAVAQLINKYPTEFEFNLTFLEIILSNVYSQLFGDFIGNNYKERMQMNRPTSLFLCFDDEKFGLVDKIKNNLYRKSDKVLLIETNDEYTFFADLIGSPVFFSESVPLINDDPPYFPEYNINELEKISFANKKDRHANAIHEITGNNYLEEEEEEEEEEGTDDKNCIEESYYVVKESDVSQEEEENASDDEYE